MSPCLAATSSPVEACWQEHCFYLEVAATPQARLEGLMFRPSMSPQEGMLMVFDAPGYYPVWMRNMKFSVDVLWLSPERTVLEVVPALQPCQKGKCPSVNPSVEALYIVELKGGTVEKLGIRAGDFFYW